MVFGTCRDIVCRVVVYAWSSNINVQHNSVVSHPYAVNDSGQLSLSSNLNFVFTNRNFRVSNLLKSFVDERTCYRTSVCQKMNRCRNERNIQRFNTVVILVLCLTKVCTSEEKYCYQGLHDMAANVKAFAMAWQ